MRADGLHSECGRGTDDGCKSHAKGSCDGAGRPGRGGTDAVPEAEGAFSLGDMFAPVEECPGGVCAVPWSNAKPELLPDNVNHPSHYTDGGIETIEGIEAALSQEEFMGFLRGNILKYVWRMRLKGNPKEDLSKAIWYAERLMDQLD